MAMETTVQELNCAEAYVMPEEKVSKPPIRTDTSGFMMTFGTRPDVKVNVPSGLKSACEPVKRRAYKLPTIGFAV